MPSGCRVRADHERRVLVVDDEPTIVVTLQDDLEEHGFVVVTARDVATRILVVSANFAGHEALLRAAGAEACLPKPFANREVLAWLEVRRTA